MARHIPRYGIFIIESMDWNNERAGNLDGFALKKMLDLCGIDCEYIYIRTFLEFELAINLFKESDFGFLHIACHGTEQGLSFTLEDVLFEELAEIMGPNLKYRRLFLSACKAARFEFAELFIPKYHCYSLMGSPAQLNMIRPQFSGALIII